MSNIAQLGFRVDTNELADAKRKLNEIVPASEKAGRAADGFSQKAARMGSTLSTRVVGAFNSAKAAIVSFGAGILAAFSFQAIMSGLSATADRIDDVSKAASKLRVNMGDLQGLALAADLAGVSFSELATIANKMNKVIGQAIAKGKETDGVFKLLGISARDLSKMTIDERFGAIADRMNAMGLTADQTALILGQLGDRSGTLAALFEGGSAAIKDASDQLDRFNGKLTNQQGKDVERMNDAFTSLQYAIQSAGNQVVAFLAPFVSPVVEQAAEIIGLINRSFMWVGSSASTAANAVRSAFDIIMSAFNPVYGAITKLSTFFRQAFGVTIAQAVKTGANAIINSMVGAYSYIATIWDGFPILIKAAAIGAVNAVIDGVNKMISASISGLNTLQNAVNTLFPDAVKARPFDTKMFQIDKYDNPYASEANKITGDAANAFKAQLQVDNFANSVTKTKDATTTASAAVTDFGNALGGAGNAADGAGQKMSNLQSITEQLSGIGEPFEQAKTAFEKLEELQKNGIITGDQYSTMLGRIEQAFIAAGGTADQWGKIVSDRTSQMADAMQSFAESSLSSVGDTLADLVVDGKANFKQLADSIIKDMIRMAWQALVVKPLLGGLFGFADGGGFSSSGLIPFAKGGTFTNKIYNQATPFAFANGGSFGAGVMGEAGAEAVMPLKRGPNGRLGVDAHGMNGRRGSGPQIKMGDVHITQQSSGDSGKDNAHAAETAAQVEAAMRRVALEVLHDNMRYGGALSPRG